ncbi:Uncharacterised protein [Salmonella enterica subsp. arizonae]|nr:Uncharacterised protein [Salmonella enterica subsp. arizonae]
MSVAVTISTMLLSTHFLRMISETVMRPWSGHCLSVKTMPADKTGAGRTGGGFPLLTLIFLLLTSVFTSGFLTGALTVIWFVSAGM